MKLTIIGASGHGKVVADIAKKNGYDKIEFLDDDINIKKCGVYPVVGKTNLASNISNDIFIGIGNIYIREKMMERYHEKNIVTLIHPNAIIADDVILGKGTVVMAGAVINSGAIIGNGVIVNTSSSIDHDCKISDYVHVAVGSHICGTVEVGARSWIGAGATIINNLKVCDDCIVGAGAVVISDIISKGTYVGVPVKKVKVLK